MNTVLFSIYMLISVIYGVFAAFAIETGRLSSEDLYPVDRVRTYILWAGILTTISVLAMKDTLED